MSSALTKYEFPIDEDEADDDDHDDDYVHEDESLSQKRVYSCFAEIQIWTKLWQSYFTL